jgi:2-polyprenyl-6-methoxyphenol hydroxylase-like FAD-dependent oxidoreductase
VNAALEDALSLGEALEGIVNVADLPSALEIHGARRAAHVAPVVLAGRRLRDRFLDPAAHPGEPSAPLVK